MGKKIFVSYKYADSDVEKLPYRSYLDQIVEPTTVRHYVDHLQTVFAADDHINKGERDGESLAGFKDSAIESRLRDKIWDSSITLVLISPNMKESWNREDDQWIPWEISYSLSEYRRNGRTSTLNAVLAIVVPDRNSSYGYYIQEDMCPYCNCRILQSDKTFEIITRNMFNRKDIEEADCSGSHSGIRIYKGDSSYIEVVKWADFIGNPTYWLGRAELLRNSAASFNIVKRLN